jgi:hypothetical protein
MTYSELEYLGTGEYPVRDNSFGIERVNYDSRTGRIAVRVGDFWKSCGSVECDESFEDEDHFLFYLNGEKVCGGVLEPITDDGNKEKS